MLNFVLLLSLGYIDHDAHWSPLLPHFSEWSKITKKYGVQYPMNETIHTFWIKTTSLNLDTASTQLQETILQVLLNH